MAAGKALKIILGIVVAFVLVIAGLVVLAVVSVDAIARRAVEQGGTYALGVPTTLQSADVGLTSGSFSMTGLRVANPPGFTGPDFFTLGSGGVKVDLNTLQQPTVELPLLRLETIAAHLERRGGDSNYNVILANLKKLSGPGGGEQPPAQPDPDAKKFIIRELLIRDVDVTLDVLGLPQGAPVGGELNKLAKVTIPIDEIRLNNVGQTGEGVAGSGVTMEQLVGIVVRAVLGAAAEKGGGLIPDDILGDLKGSLASLGSLDQLGMSVTASAQGVVENLAGQAQQQAEKALEEGKKAVEKVGEDLKNLIPGQKPN